jgi:phosphopantothenoylcysteine decarboxylase / phosphopantothenate---cysteine ligase
MGYAIADELAQRGAEVTLISGPVDLKSPAGIDTLIKVQTADEMFNECVKGVETYDILVLAAAVADYTPVEVAAQKMKKGDDGITVALKKTKDILSSIGANKKEHQVLVGFALETTNEKENALRKLEKKNADLIVLNSMNDKGAGFKKDTNKITIFQKMGIEREFEAKSKTLVAKDIVDALTELLP